MKRLLSAVLCFMMIIGLTPAMSLTASATKTYRIGTWYDAPTYEVETEYGPSTWDFKVSESGMVEFSNNNKQMKFLKPGKVTITTEWYRTDVRGRTLVPVYGSFVNEYEVDGTPQNIQTTTIKLDSNKFVGGGTFPEFVVTSDSHCKVTEATFYAEMCDYYTGDKLPSYRSGTVMKNVIITLKPDVGYVFAFGGSNDDKLHENTVYKVEYKGKTYTPYVKHNTTENEMRVYLDVTFEEGAIYQTTIKDLEAPYHYGPLDKTATVEDALEVVSIKYTMFNKELTSFSKGDNIGIAVRVKTKDNTNKIDPNGKAYWMEQKIYSSKTTKISDYEVEYDFSYTVDATDEQTIKWADFAIPSVYTGEALPANAFSSTDGIIVKSVTWTPNDAKVDANKEYTVKIEFAKKDEYIYASDFADQGVVHINGERAKFVDETTTQGKFSNIKYFAEATFMPVTVVYTDTSNNSTTTSTTTTTTTTTDQWVNVNVVDTTTTENTDKTEGTEKVDVTEKSDGKSDGKSEVENEESAEKKTEDEKPQQTDSEDYQFPFVDVLSNQWYYESVKGAHKMGLINGKTETEYKPDDNMTYAEAIKLAACMSELYTKGEITVKPGNPWYQPFVDYCKEYHIVEKEYDYDAYVTRAGYIEIFAKALPEEGYGIINEVPDNAIPDVASDSPYAASVYKLYRAGILTGVDDAHNCDPDANITRSEVAAILIRIMDEGKRIQLKW